MGGSTGAGGHAYDRGVGAVVWECIKNHRYGGDVRCRGDPPVCYVTLPIMLKRVIAVKRVFALLACLLLGACVSRPWHRLSGTAVPYRQKDRIQYWRHVDHWCLRARLGVSDGQHGGSGSLIWTQRGERSDIMFRGPVFSSLHFHLHVDTAGAWLSGLSGGTMHASNARALMRRALGWVLPLHDLQAWVFGLSAPKGRAVLHVGADGLPSQLQQHGWTIRYRAWNRVINPPLPQRIFVDKPPYKVRLSVQSWQFPG